MPLYASSETCLFHRTQFYSIGNVFIPQSNFELIACKNKLTQNIVDVGEAYNFVVQIDI